MPERIYGYPPVIDGKCRILIVGSMPSVKSLEVGFYYGHPQNAFWRMMAQIFHAPVPESIPEKKMLLLNNHAALWDVYASCIREGSLDSAIRAGEINDFSGLFKEYPGLCAVLCNGGAAHAAFPKHAFSGEILKLPSTSPAYTMKYESKLIAWREAISKYL